MNHYMSYIVPLRHVLLIGDGCRRYARNIGLSEDELYLPTQEHLKDVIDWFIRKFKVPIFTIYGLSYDNFIKRLPSEIKQVFSMWTNLIDTWIEEDYLNINQISVHPIGELSLLPDDVFDRTLEVSKISKSYSKFKLNILLNYSGQREILKTAKSIINSFESIDQYQKMFERNLDLTDPVDITIRTSEHRISNCPLYQLAYSEIYFIDKLFPETTYEDYKQILIDYSKTERRYGGNYGCGKNESYISKY